jgi:hypothetical protein
LSTSIGHRAKHLLFQDEGARYDTRNYEHVESGFSPDMHGRSSESVVDCVDQPSLLLSDNCRGFVDIYDTCHKPKFLLRRDYGVWSAIFSSFSICVARGTINTPSH